MQLAHGYCEANRGQTPKKPGSDPTRSNLGQTPNQNGGLTPTSEAECDAARPRVARAAQHAALGVELYELHRAAARHRTEALHGVAVARERLDRFFGDALLEPHHRRTIDVHGIGAGEAVPARRVDSLLQRHAVIDDAGDDLRAPLRLLVAAGCAAD